jgi:hypothetical protein
MLTIDEEMNEELVEGVNEVMFELLSSVVEVVPEVLTRSLFLGGGVVPPEPESDSVLDASVRSLQFLNINFI